MRLRLAVLSWFLILEAGVQAQTVVPFRLIDGWAIVLEGTLGGDAHQKILIDTGAVPSVINIRVARRLGLAGQVRALSLMNREMQAERVRVPNVQVGCITAESVDMTAVNLERIEQALGTRIDAVIGLDLLSQQNLSIDYRRKELTFGKNAALRASIPFETKEEAGGTYILIPLESNGEKLRMLLDTGTKDLMLFEPRLRGGLQRLQVRGTDSNSNSSGQDSVAVVELQSVYVGPLSWKKRKAFVWAIPQNEVRDFDGMMGPAAFGIQAVAIDFDRRMISFEVQ